MSPQGELASTTFCLADPDNAYVVYLPSGGNTTVDLRKTTARFSVEWLDPTSGHTIAGASVDGGVGREFKSPFPEDAVLSLSRL